MGMYTEIFFRAEVDAEAYSVLELLCKPYVSMNYSAVDFGDVRLPNHLFFTKRSFRFIAQGSSYMFPAANHAVCEIDRMTHETMYSVSFRASLKNYDEEIESFFDWVTPHCKIEQAQDAVNDPARFIGYSQYEEQAIPHLYFATGSH